MFLFWREWLEKAERGEYTPDFPVPSEYDITSPIFADTAPGNWVTVKMPRSHAEERRDYPDIRKTNIPTSRVLVSRKRTKNLYDVTNLWKKCILNSLQEGLQSESDSITPNIIHLSPEDAHPRHQVLKSHREMDPTEIESDDEIVVGRASPSRIPKAWHAGAW